MRFLGLRFFFLACFALGIEHSFCQNQAIGTWKMYLPYGQSLGACDAGDKVYSAAAKSIFSYEKSTGVVQTYDKASGLSDLGIQCINYDLGSKFLAIAYVDGNLDFLYDGTTVYNIPDIKNQSTSGSIAIYSISFLNGNAYISSDLGISVVNLSQMQINSTYVVGSTGGQVSVYSTSFDAVNIYAATAEGVKYAPLNAPNLQDFTEWHTFGLAQNLPAKKATFVQAFNNKVYAVVPSGNDRDTLYQFNGTSWSVVFYLQRDTITSLSVSSGSLRFTAWDTINGTKGWLCAIDGQGSLSYNEPQGHFRPSGWFISDGVSWEPDFYNGLFENIHGYVDDIVPTGPFTPSVFALNSKNGVLDVAPGSVNDSWVNQNNHDGFFIYKNGTWQNTNMFNTGALTGYDDILCTASVPVNNKTYFGSFYAGLIEQDDNTGNLTLYNETSAGGLLQGVIGDPGRTKVSCLLADSNNNLWIGNAGAPSLIKVIKPDGSWHKYTVPSTVTQIFVPKKMAMDQYGQIWMPTFQDNGLLVFNYGDSVGDVTNAQFKFLQSGTGAGGLPSNNVYCVAVDHSGNVWIGTDAGIGTFYCAGSVFNGGCDATQIKVTLNGYVGYLFGMQTVRALAVDAANRIWVGTTDGIWLISNDGQTTYLNFTTANSPLPNNQITDIAIDDATGEVYIATIGGLVSYQGDAIGASCADCNSALVYPNPVRPDYTGPISIKGLTDNAYVKITDVSGNMVFQGRANGTQMVWSGNGYNGNRAKSGVYLVFSSTDAGKQKRVAKILIAD